MINTPEHLFQKNDRFRVNELFIPGKKNLPHVALEGKGFA